ncbi:MAG: hypothetical protein LUB61_04595 [Eggerthellaceae bacterium]|nr:hypothetical protein [Eggerthellaceae bacterium]
MGVEVVDHNPLLKKPILAILSLVRDGDFEGRTGLEDAAKEIWRDDYRQSATTTIDILIRNNAITQEIFVNGEPYEGTFEDIQLDESVPDDAEVDVLIDITDTGEEILRLYTPDATLKALFEDRPHYADVFSGVLAACTTEEGLSRMELEEVINGYPQLKPDPDRRQQKVYPQYFIDALESAGGIEWDGAWKTTAAGKTVLDK